VLSRREEKSEKVKLKDRYPFAIVRGGRIGTRSTGQARGAKEVVAVPPLKEGGWWVLSKLGQRKDKKKRGSGKKPSLLGRELGIVFHCRGYRIGGLTS